MQIYTGDRVGDYIMQGAQGLGAGIGGGLANMADAFAKAQEKKKQMAAQGKAADAFVKSSPDLLKSMGMTPEDWALQSPTDKHAAVQGAMGAQAFAEGQQRGEERTLRMLEMEQQLKDREDAAQNAGKFGGFMSEAGRLMQPRMNPDPGQVGTGEDVPLEVPGLDAFSAMGEAARSSGYRPDPRTLDDLMRAGERKGSGLPDWEGIKPREFETKSGKRGVYGKGGQFQFEPGEADAAKPKTPEINEDFLYADDDKTFEQGVRGLSTQAQRDAALEFRRKLKAAKASPNAMGEFLKTIAQPEPEKPSLWKRIFGGGESKTNAPAPSATVGKWNPATGKLELNR